MLSKLSAEGLSQACLSHFGPAPKSSPTYNQAFAEVELCGSTQDASSRYVLFVCNSSGKIALRFAFYKGMKRVYHPLRHKAVDRKVRATEPLLGYLGVPSDKLSQQWPAGKRVMTQVSELTPAVRAQFEALGWQFREEVFAEYAYALQSPQEKFWNYTEVQAYGLALDVSNLLRDAEWAALCLELSASGDRTTPTGLLRRVMDALEEQGITAYLYVDSGNREAIRALQDDFPLIISRKGCSIDPLLLAEAQAKHLHVVSNDSFTDQPLFDSWLVPEAQQGRVKLHDFLIKGSAFSIPDFGIRVKIEKRAYAAA